MLILGFHLTYSNFSLLPAFFITYFFTMCAQTLFVCSFSSCVFHLAYFHFAGVFFISLWLVEFFLCIILVSLPVRCYIIICHAV